MRILILGASGYAGSCIKKALEKEYQEVFGTYQNQMKAGQFSGDSSMYQYALGKQGELEALLRKTDPDVVISCLRGDFGRQKEAHKALGEFLAGKENGSILYLSSANVFDGDLRKPHLETDLPKAESSYGQFKIACEELLAGQLGERAVILRIPEIWGTGCPRLKKFQKDVPQGRPVQTYGNFWVNYTTDRQITAWVSYIMKQNLHGVFHIGTRNLYGYTAFQEELAERLGVGTPVFEIEENQEKQVLAVVPGRQEIPERLQIGVEDVLRLASGRERWMV